MEKRLSQAIQSYFERETALVLEGQEHEIILTGLAEYWAGIQRHCASEHWGCSKRRDAGQRSPSVALAMRQTIHGQGEEQDKEQTTAFGERDTGAFEQETLSLTKRVFTWVDRIGACDLPCDSWDCAYVQSARM